MNGLRIGSLCSGIGGLELGLERAGLGHTVWQIEIHPERRAVLEKHWPGVRRWDDLKTFPGWEADIVCGGFPCQPYSKGGLGLAEKDPRDLWEAVARTLGLVRPRYVVLENVERLLQLGMGRVLGDLAALGYDAEWDCVPACAVGAPHQRDRVFVLAYANGGGQLHRWAGVDAAEGRQQAQSLSLCGGEAMAGPRAIPHAHPEGCDRTALCQRWPAPSAWNPGWSPEPGVRRLADGLPGEVGELEGYGNAVVPQVAEHIGRILRSRIGGGA